MAKDNTATVEPTQHVAPLAKKLTVELLDTYAAELQKQTEAKAALKPISDRVNALFGHIEELFLKTKKQLVKVGNHKLDLKPKKGAVSWKTELAKRLSSEDLAALESAVETTNELVIA